MLLQERSDRWFRHESISVRKGNVGGCRYPPKMEIGKACLSRLSKNIPSKTLCTFTACQNRPADFKLAR